MDSNVGTKTLYLDQNSKGNSSQRQKKLRARSEPMRDDTMSCFSNAPLAQLAEQLTLNQFASGLSNQFASGLSPDKLGISNQPAAHSAVWIHEINDPELRSIIQSWDSLHRSFRNTISQLVSNIVDQCVQ